MLRSNATDTTGFSKNIKIFECIRKMYETKGKQCDLPYHTLDWNVNQRYIKWTVMAPAVEIQDVYLDACSRVAVLKVSTAKDLDPARNCSQEPILYSAHCVGGTYFVEISMSFLTQEDKQHIRSYVEYYNNGTCAVFWAGMDVTKAPKTVKIATGVTYFLVVCKV